MIRPITWRPNGSNVITEISSGGQITVNMGRKIYDDPNNPYGIDLIVYGNSFFSAFGTGGSVSDNTDLNATMFSGNGILRSCDDRFRQPGRHQLVHLRQHAGAVSRQCLSLG